MPWSPSLWVSAPCILAPPPPPPPPCLFLLPLSPHPSSLAPLPPAPCPLAPRTPHQNAPVCSALGWPLLPAFVSDPLSFMALSTPPWREGQGGARADQGGGPTAQGFPSGQGHEEVHGALAAAVWGAPVTLSRYPCLETPQPFTTLVTRAHFCFPKKHTVLGLIPSHSSRRRDIFP